MREEKIHLGECLDVGRARTLIVQDVWTGYSHLAPVAAVYELKRTRSGGLTGEGVLSVADSTPKRVPIAMKSATVVAFLEGLASAELVERPTCRTRITPTTTPGSRSSCRCPRGISAVDQESRSSTRSRRAIPWAVFVGGKGYVATGDEVGRALHALGRPLKKSLLLRRMTG